jgi:hypothetical protein
MGVPKASPNKLLPGDSGSHGSKSESQKEGRHKYNLGPGRLSVQTNMSHFLHSYCSN